MGLNKMIGLKGYQKYYHHAVQKFGKQNQLDMAEEEIGEYLVALKHIKRNKCTKEDLTNEMADVLHTMAQAMIVYGITDEDLEYALDKKIKGLLVKLYPFEINKQKYPYDQRWDACETNETQESRLG
jgi:NTP pyrophosphatase (non-canonical NTP hydrolase)